MAAGMEVAAAGSDDGGWWDGQLGERWERRRLGEREEGGERRRNIGRKGDESAEANGMESIKG